MRKITFANGEFYHIYNRGVDKRDIFLDRFDFDRFLKSMEEFNALDPIGSIYEKSFLKEKPAAKKIVNFVAYCLNPNHYHFILKQVADRGIEKFMQRLGTGYTKYFNNRHQRSGILFQGVFKAAHIDSNEYLLHLSAYVNLNNRIHRLGSFASKSSWGEYMENKIGFANQKNLILKQFRGRSEYKKFAESSLVDILDRKLRYKEMEYLLFD